MDALGKSLEQNLHALENWHKKNGECASYQQRETLSRRIEVAEVLNPKGMKNLQKQSKETAKAMKEFYKLEKSLTNNLAQLDEVFSKAVGAKFTSAKQLSTKEIVTSATFLNTILRNENDLDDAVFYVRSTTSKTPSDTKKKVSLV